MDECSGEFHEHDGAEAVDFTRLDNYAWLVSRATASGGNILNL